MSKFHWVAATLSVSVVFTVALGGPIPPLAQAADCIEYQWIGDYALNQDDGWRVEFSAQGQLAQSTPVVATSPTGDTQGGILAGSISGDHINFTVHWDSGWLSNYSGNAAQDGSGFVYGGYLGQDRPDGAQFDKSWDSTVPLGCAEEAGIPPGQLPIPADQPVP